MITMAEPFKIKAYRKKELAALYDVSTRVFKIWLKNIAELGDYTGRSFTPKQVEKIVEHLGEP